ncbi:MAG: WXG100 family type VII secretion target [Lachnospiraceae bacterium]|nr:WXG100 family type VII secretion target [Lachnospiraceae bacterium]
MGKIIRVTPEELGKAAVQLREYANEYNSLREKMLSEVSNLASKWQGEDNLAFTKKIEGAIQSLQAMIDALNKEAENLDLEKTNYQAQQQAVIDGLR